MATKYVSTTRLGRFLAKLKEIFATKTDVSDATKDLVTNDALDGKGYQTAEQVSAAVTAGTAGMVTDDSLAAKGYQTASDVDKAVIAKGYQTAEQVDTAITGKGYDTTASVDKKVSDAKAEIQASIGSAFTPKGSCAFAELPTTGRKFGDVWNITDSFTTTTDFVEGEGKAYPAGTNVVLVEVTTGEGEDATKSPKWDALSGVTDLSGFVPKTDFVEATDADIDALFA